MPSKFQLAAIVGSPPSNRHSREGWNPVTFAFKITGKSKTNVNVPGSPTKALGDDGLAKPR
jgi:hypothetical protein